MAQRLKTIAYRGNAMKYVFQKYTLYSKQKVDITIANSIDSYIKNQELVARTFF